MWFSPSHTRLCRKPRTVGRSDATLGPLSTGDYCAPLSHFQRAWCYSHRKREYTFYLREAQRSIFADGDLELVNMFSHAKAVTSAGRAPAIRVWEHFQDIWGPSASNHLPECKQFNTESLSIICSQVNRR